MADSGTPREELEKTVKQMILLSIGLEFEEKGQLIGKLPALSGEQLEQLKEVFEEENKRKEQMLSDFFEKNPQLYPEFEHFSKQHVSSVYQKVEGSQKDQEEARMAELLTVDF